MNARRARARRHLRRREIERLLAQGRQVQPRLVGAYAGQEAWMVGPVLHIIPILRDAYPQDLKAAVDRRRRAALTGRCDCGAVWAIDRGRAHMAHEDGCPAIDDVLFEIGRRHGYAFSRWAA